MVVVSLNVDFSELLHSPADPNQHLLNLKDAFGAHDSSCIEEALIAKPASRVRDVYDNLSEWESDTKILQLRVTEDDVVPNGPNPVVPRIPREPEVPICGGHHSEVEHLADVAGPPLAQEKRRACAAIGAKHKSSASRDDVSVGVVEIEEKEAGKARKHTYHEALLAAENTHIHNEPVDINDAKQKPDWPKWEAAM